MEKSSEICQQAHRLSSHLVSRRFSIKIYTENNHFLLTKWIIWFALFAVHLSEWVRVNARVNIVALIAIHILAEFIVAQNQMG